MKALIAAACLAVIAAVGYYFWGEFAEWRSASADQAAARQEIYRLAGVQPGTRDEMGRVIRWCKAIDEKLSDNGFTGEATSTARRVVQNCRFFGYL